MPDCPSPIDLDAHSVSRWIAAETVNHQLPRSPPSSTLQDATPTNRNDAMTLSCKCKLAEDRACQKKRLVDVEPGDARGIERDAQEVVQ